MVFYNVATTAAKYMRSPPEGETEQSEVSLRQDWLRKHCQSIWTKVEVYKNRRDAFLVRPNEKTLLGNSSVDLSVNRSLIARIATIFSDAVGSGLLLILLNPISTLIPRFYSGCLFCPSRDLRPS